MSGSIAAAPWTNTNMDPRLDNYDWAQVFGCIGETSADDNYVYSMHNSGVATLACDPLIVPKPESRTYKRSDVVEVIAMEDGENDGADWVGVFKMVDGMYLFVYGGCDYTGWDCQSGGGGFFAPSLRGLIQFGMDGYHFTRLSEQLHSYDETLA